MTTDKATDVTVTQAIRDAAANAVIEMSDRTMEIRMGDMNHSAVVRAFARIASEQSATGEVKVLREALAGLVAQRFDYPGPVEGAMHLWEEARHALLITSEAPAQEDQQ